MKKAYTASTARLMLRVADQMTANAGEIFRENNLLLKFSPHTIFGHGTIKTPDTTGRFALAEGTLVRDVDPCEGNSKNGLAERMHDREGSR